MMNYSFERYVYRMPNDTNPYNCNTLSYSELTNDKTGQLQELSELTSFGDYSNSCLIHVSNFHAAHALLVDYIGRGAWVVTGGYGSTGLLIDRFLLESDDDFGDIVTEIRDSLSDYPLLDEDDYSKREWDSYQEQWEEYAQDDFMRGIQKKFDVPDETVEWISESIAAARNDDFDVLDWQEFYESILTSGEWYIDESPNGVFILINHAIDKITEDNLKDFISQAIISLPERRAARLQISMNL